MTCLWNDPDSTEARIDRTATRQSTSEPLRASMDGMFIGDDIAVCRIASSLSYLAGVAHALTSMHHAFDMLLPTLYPTRDPVQT